VVPQAAVASWAERTGVMAVTVVEVADLVVATAQEALGVVAAAAVDTARSAMVVLKATVVASTEALVEVLTVVAATAVAWRATAEAVGWALVVSGVTHLCSCNPRD